MNGKHWVILLPFGTTLCNRCCHNCGSLVGLCCWNPLPRANGITRLIYPDVYNINCILYYTVLYIYCRLTEKLLKHAGYLKYLLDRKKMKIRFMIPTLRMTNAWNQNHQRLHKPFIALPHAQRRHPKSAVRPRVRCGFVRQHLLWSFIEKPGALSRGR